MDPNKALACILAGLGLLILIGVLGGLGVLPFFDPAIDAPNQTVNQTPDGQSQGSAQPLPPPPPAATPPLPPASTAPPPSTPPPPQSAIPLSPPSSTPSNPPVPSAPQPQPALEKKPAAPSKVASPAAESKSQPRRGLPEADYFTFDKAEPGALPSGWTAIRGTWAARQDPKALAGTGVNVLAQLDQVDGGSDAIVLSNNSVLKNVQVSSNLRVSNMPRNQTAGLVFRYQDPQDYYSVGLDTLNQRVTFYKTVAGATRVVYFASTNRIRSNEWNYLQVAATGEHIRVRLNDDNYISIKETTFSEGKSGLWTVGETAAVFDNAEVRKLP